MTIQSSSPRTTADSRRGSLARLADTVTAAGPRVLRRVLGRAGSSSRRIRRTSSYPAVRNRSLSNGVVPVNSSYRSTPRA
jgi:hypothetical protein